MGQVHGSTEPLRLYLLKMCTDALLLDIGHGDGRGTAEHLGRDFATALATGVHTDTGPGNAYEACIMQPHAHDRNPLRMVFAAWWIGTFCSRLAANGLDNNVLIDNLRWSRLLESLVTACLQLGAPAAHAAVPFVLFLAERRGEPLPADFGSGEDLFPAARRALEAIETLGPDTARSERLTGFLAMAERCPW